MSLPKEAKEKIKKLGLDVDKLIEAITAEAETPYDVPDVVALSPDELTARDNNMKKEGAKDAEPAVRKTLINELGKKLNIEIKSERIGDVVAEIQTFANKNSDEKVGLLQKQVEALTADKTNLSQTLEQEKARAAQASFDAELISYFPPSRGADLTDADRLSIIKSNLQFETVDGAIVVKKGGQVLLDDATKAPKAPKAALDDLFKEKPSLIGVVKTPGGGRGGNDDFGGSGGTGIKKFSQAKEQWLKENPQGNITSPEFNDYTAKLALENTDFNWYE